MDREKWTDTALERLRKLGDPDADAAVRDVKLRGTVAEVSVFLGNLIQNDTSILDPGSPVKIPPEITEFIASHSALPEWADKEKIALGQRMFAHNGPAALATLLCASLPECYSHKKGVQVLWYTQNLEEHTVRRVYQTARFILDVMRTGGLAAGGPGVLSATKTRLFHAAMRHLILTRPDDAPTSPPGLADELLHSDWKEEWGTPINVEDLIFTLLSFSFVILRSWERLGYHLSTAEQEAYLHCWNVIGYFLGIPDEYALTSRDDAEFAFERLQAHQQAGSPEGIKLTEALRAVMEKIVPSPALASHIEHTLMRYLMSDKTADILGVAEPDGFDHLITLGIQIWRIANEGLGALETIVKESASLRSGAPEDEPPDLAVLIGRALNELIVALLGRGEHGFDAGEIGEKATNVKNMSGKVTITIKDEVVPILHADSSPATKNDVAEGLGRSLVAILSSSAAEPSVPPTKAPRPVAAVVNKLLAKPPKPPISLPRKPYVMPPEFKTGKWAR